MPIRLLPAHIIAHISAGEVIDRPTSVVKELIENALDAGAENIQISLQKSGIKSIKVIDDGKGIPEQDIKLVFAQHATSKLSEEAELWKLHSFGFRGEALHSIMTVADVELFSKAQNAEMGTQVFTFKGVVQGVLPVGYRQGTSIEVKQLFQRMPIRQKHLSVTRELKAIKKLITTYALQFPKVSFQLTNNEKQLLHFFPRTTLVDRIADIWNVLPENIQQKSLKTEYGRVAIVFASPQRWLHRPNYQSIFINSRPVEYPLLHQYFIESLSTFRHAGLYPQYLLQFDLDPEVVDVNLHPQKTTVKILDEEKFLDIYKQELQQAMNQLSASSVRYAPKPVADTSIPAVNEQPEFEIKDEILQIDNTYLVAHTSWGVLFVDQHAADEKLWYNKLMKNKKLQKKLETHLSEQCRKELADDVYQHSFREEINARIATISCHQAIRAGQPLSQTEATELINKIIEGGTQTLTCPHGRPTHQFFTSTQMAQLFRRT